MDDNNNNIFEMLDSSPTTKKMKTNPTSNSPLTLRRSRHLPVINAGSNGLYTSAGKTTSSSGDGQRKRRRDRALQDLGFVNPGPKNLVNVATVPARRLKTRQASTQEKPSTSRPLYDESGLLVSDQTDRCDCNRFNCSGCFLPCSTCQSPKCGLECRNLRTYTYEYRLYGTNKEIVQK